MPRYLSCLFGVLIAFLLVAGPVAYAVYEQSNIRNFHVVREGALYRSGQMTLPGLERVIHDYGIRTVVTLRDAYHLGDPPPDKKEEDYCRDHGINYERISPRSWWAPAGEVPAEEGVRQFRQVMDNPENFPVLVHCFAGIHRTGAFCAIYHMEYEHWSNERAIDELKANGYTNLDDEWDVLTYLERYHPRWRGPAPEVPSIHEPPPASFKRHRHKKPDPSSW
jgi:protein tyrosine/serine phosphatase